MNSPSLPADTRRAATRRGILALSLAMAAFIVNDALVKFVSQSLGTVQLVFVRGALATVLLLGVARAMGATRQLSQLRPLFNRRVAARSLLDALGTMTYLTALFHMPIGNATAINMASPLVIMLFAVLFLRERVGVARWLAMAAGFAGVLMIIQPSAHAFNAYALLCFTGTVVHALRDFITRFVPPDIPSILVALSTMATVTVLMGVAILFMGWQPMTWAQLGWLAAAAVFLSAAYLLLINSMREGDISVIAPFRYTGLLFALVLGWLVWGDVPNPLAWAGIALLVAAGLYVLHGERARQRAELEAAAD